MSNAGRLWYLGTWYLARDQDPVYQALLSHGWKPQQEFDATGGFLVLLTGGGTSAPNLVEQGIGATSDGHFAQAVARYESALAKNPLDVDAPYDLGVLYQQSLHNPGLAAMYYADALRLDPTYKPAMFNLAIVDSSRDPQEAIALYHQLLAVNPNDANAAFNLGLLLIAHNQSVEGHADLKKALLLNPALTSRLPKGVTP
jgi:tetratricopeptide (TPR) repeat protein